MCSLLEKCNALGEVESARVCTYIARAWVGIKKKLKVFYDPLIRIYQAKTHTIHTFILKRWDFGREEDFFKVESKPILFVGSGEGIVFL